MIILQNSKKKKIKNIQHSGAENSKIISSLRVARYTLVISTFCSVSFFWYMVTMLASFQACGTWPSSHIFMIHRCSLLEKLTPPYFHTSAGIPSPPGDFPSFSPLITLAISSIVGFSSRAVLTLCYCTFSSTSGSMSTGIFL